MAYASYVHSSKRSEVAHHKSHAHRKHNYISISANTRRFFHICIGILIGVFLSHTFVSPFTRPSCPKPDSDLSATVAHSQYLEKQPTPWKPSNASSLLFVGVITAQKYLETRATAVYQTWGKDVPGRIAFFSSATSTPPDNFPQLPLVKLKNVDDSYPPQKKSFMMLLYMWENFGDEYEWFLRADDDVYIRPDKVESFLRSINSSQPHFIGQAGRGNQEEFGQLSLKNDENFCMGGPGVILSRETLSKVAPHVKYCLQNLFTTHEDVELGRCVRKFANIPCTWSYEMQSIFYHNFSGSLAFTGNLKTKEVNRAITLHPIKHHQHMYRLHNYMQGLSIHELQQQKITLYRDLLLMQQLSGNSSSIGNLFKKLMFHNDRSNEIDMLRKSSLLGIPAGLNKYRPRKGDDVFTWDLINHSLFSNSNLNPRRKIESYLKEGLDDVIRELMDNMNFFSRERGRIIEFQQILYGYYRLNPLYGPDYILDVLLTFKKYRGRKMTVPVRRHAYIQQQFADLEIREAAESIYQGELNLETTMNPLHLQPKPLPQLLAKIYFVEPAPNQHRENEKLINMIVSLYRKHEAFVQFLQIYEQICLKQYENIALYIILFLNEETEVENEVVLQKVQNMIEKLQHSYKHARIRVIPMKGTFSRAKALDRGMAQINSNALLFFIDIDMVWTRETLQRVRLNTAPGRSVYFPIVFSEFDPNLFYRRNISPNHFHINDETGYWRIFGYGILSVYKEDILKIGGFNTSIVGWGREDVDLFEKFILSTTNVSVLRSVDPNLVHVFHVVDCDSSLDLARLVMCRNTRSETYGSVNQLSEIVYKHNLFQYALNISSANKYKKTERVSMLNAKPPAIEGLKQEQVHEMLRLATRLLAFNNCSLENLFLDVRISDSSNSDKAKLDDYSFGVSELKLQGAY